MPGPDSKIEAVSQGFVDYLNSRQQIIDLSLAEDGLAKSFPGRPESASSSYPANPYIQCPRLLLVTEDAIFRPRTGGGGLIHDVVYTCSIFYQRRQVPGQQHHAIMRVDADSIINPFSHDKLQPPPLTNPSIPGFLLTKCFPGQVTFHPDLYHEFRDPYLTVSVVQVNFVIEGRIAIVS